MPEYIITSVSKRMERVRGARLRHRVNGHWRTERVDAYVVREQLQDFPSYGPSLLWALRGFYPMRVVGVDIKRGR